MTTVHLVAPGGQAKGPHQPLDPALPPGLPHDAVWAAAYLK